MENELDWGGMQGEWFLDLLGQRTDRGAGSEAPARGGGSSAARRCPSSGRFVLGSEVVHNFKRLAAVDVSLTCWFAFRLLQI